MKTALQIFSWFAIVLGGFAILGASTGPTTEDVIYSLMGGGLFLTQGVLALIYISQKEK